MFQKKICLDFQKYQCHEKQGKKKKTEDEEEARELVTMVGRFSLTGL